jgi:hypothetical protein
MSHAKNATSTPSEAILDLELFTDGPISVEIETRPAPCVQMVPCLTTMNCRVAGYYKVSFKSLSTRKPTNMVDIRSGTPEICEDRAAITSSPNNVLESSHHYPSPVVPNSPTGRFSVNGTAACQPHTPHVARHNSPAPSTVADSGGASLEGSYKSQRKRRRSDADEHTGSENEGDHVKKRSRASAHRSG